MALAKSVSPVLPAGRTNEVATSVDRPVMKWPLEATASDPSVSVRDSNSPPWTVCAVVGISRVANKRTHPDTVHCRDVSTGLRTRCTPTIGRLDLECRLDDAWFSTSDLQLYPLVSCFVAVQPGKCSHEESTEHHVLLCAVSATVDKLHSTHLWHRETTSRPTPACPVSTYTSRRSTYALGEFHARRHGGSNLVSMLSHPLVPATHSISARNSPLLSRLQFDVVQLHSC